MFTKYDLDEEINKFMDDSSLNKGGNPTFVLIMGGVGAGKTTLRKDKLSKGYVVIDAGQLFTNLGGTENHQFGVDFEEPMDLIGGALVSQAIKERRNIVTEIIGASVEEAKSIIDAMKLVGYKISLQHVQCDVTEAYNRHLKAVNTDPNYISSYYSQPYHRKWILEAVKK
jgi:predicted ABC-type ATPase